MISLKNLLITGFFEDSKLGGWWYFSDIISKKIKYVRNLEIGFRTKELSLKTEIKIVTLFSPKSSSNRTKSSL